MRNEDIKYDVIIPVYKPDERLKHIVKRLLRQTLPPQRIVLINTGREYFEKAFAGDDFFESCEKVLLRHISEEQFDHGGTRRLGVSYSKADYFLCMTDDALPLDPYVCERLLAPLAEGKAQVSYARQLAGVESDLSERFSRRFNYPAQSRIKTAADLSEMGIKAFFCSNVCAAYQRSTYEALGGFEKHMIFNEDMVYAGRLLDSGGAIAYVAEARVLHSHHYSAMQQLRRNFDLGVSQAQFPELFERVSSASEGVRLIRGMSGKLLRSGQAAKIPGIFVYNGCKYLGYQLGKHYKKIPEKWIMKLTMNGKYWRKKLCVES